MFEHGRKHNPQRGTHNPGGETMRYPKLPQDIRQAIKYGYDWPGGYPLFLILSDGGALCIACARKEIRNLIQAYRWNERGGWKPGAAEVNWEDPELYCANCEQRIESAYWV